MNQRLQEETRAQISLLRDEAAQKSFLAMHEELRQPYVVAELAEWVPKLIKMQPSGAMAVAEFAVLIAAGLHDSENMALALRAKANVLHAFGKNQAALEHHERARALFATAENRTQVARTLSASIQPLILLGEYERAYAAASEASSIFQEEGNDWRLARVELNTGNIFDRQDRFDEALDCYERSYRGLLPYQDQDPEAVAVVLHNMAGCFVCLNDFHAAVDTYEKARAYAVQNDLPVLVGQADYNLAWLHYLRGEYSRAISMLRATRDTCDATGDLYHFALCHLDLSEIYLELNMSVEAEEAAEEAQRNFRQLGMWYEVAKSLSNVAIALGQQGKTNQSLDAFTRARVIFVDEKNLVWCSLIDLYQALTLFNEHRDEESRLLAASALKFFSKSSLTPKTVLCHLLLTRLYLRANKLPAALRECNRVLKYLKKLESPALSCRTFGLMAQIQKGLGRNTRSYESFQRAKESLEQLRNGIRGDELKIFFMRDYAEIYEGLVELCMSTPDGAKEAFAYVEQAKSRSLLDRLTNQALDPSTAAHSENKWASRIRELREELSWYYHRTEITQLSGREHAAEQLDHLRAEASLRERELLRLSREYAPDDAQSQSSAILGLEEIQATLHAEATILEFFQVRDQYVVLVLTRDSLEIVTLGSATAVETLLLRLRFQMAKLSLGPEYLTAFEDVLLVAVQDHLRELHEALIVPVVARLRTSHLIIVPHGALHHVPFQALYDGLDYLIDRFTISYAPSVSVYSWCNTRPANAQGGSLVLAIPDAGIPLVQEEASAVAQTLPDASLAMGPNATTAVLRDLGSRSRFIHIATHGYFRQDRPMFSSIRLGDSYLSLFDLYQLRLPVELVTLSGCSTGLNVVSSGDEIVGLVRGLICAGAQSTLLTLWDVQDRSTSEFMKSFYGFLVSGRNKAEALRDAVLKLRAKYPHPYYWAPFVLSGKVFDEKRIL